MTHPGSDQPKVSETKPDDKPEPQPNAHAAPQAPADTAALLNMSLGDLLVAGAIKDPEDAGRIIAAALTQAQAPVAATPAPTAEPGPEANAKTPPAAEPTKHR